jgi:superfamily II DNA or RNA helicase
MTTTVTFDITANQNHPEIEAALAIMLRNDPDNASQRNNIGFDGASTVFGTSIARQAAKQRLSDLQTQKILKILWRHNNRQLAPAGIKLPTTGELDIWLRERERLYPYQPVVTKLPPATLSSMGRVFLQDSLLTVQMPSNFYPWVKAIKTIQVQGHTVAKYLGEPTKYWQLPLDWLDALQQVLPSTHFDYAPEVLASKAEQEKRRKLAALELEIRKEAQQARVNKLLKVARLDEPLANGWLLHDYQKECVRFIFEHEKVLVGDDLGLGKTIQSLKAAATYQQVFDCDIICIVPISTMSNWYREAEYVGCKIQVVGQTAGRIPLATSINRKFVLITDECHAFKNFGSQRTKKWLALCESPHLIANIAMSATPIKNGAPLDILPILKGLKHPLANNKKKFYDRYGSLSQGHLKELHDILTKEQPVMIRRKKKDVLVLPPFTREVVEGELSPEAQKEYNRVFLELQAEYNQRVADSEISNEGWELVLLNHLRHAGSIAKIETSLDMALSILQGVDGDSGEQVVLFTTFRDTAEKLTEAIQNAGFSVGLLTGSTPQKQRQPMFDAFQSKNLDCIVAMAQAGGVGINLFSACKVILVDRDWNLNEQLEGRCHRQGQKNPVTSYWISHTDVDKFIDNKLLEKAETSDLIVEGYSVGLEGLSWAEEAKNLLSQIFNGTYELPSVDKEDDLYLPDYDEEF